MGTMKKNADLTVHNKTNVLERYQNTSYIFYTRMCRKFISLLNGFMIQATAISIG